MFRWGSEVRYAAVYMKFVRTGPPAAATDEVVGAWMRLLLLACEMEKGVQTATVTQANPLGEGRISDCKSWDEKRWLRAAGTDAVEKVIAAGLARWQRDDLHVAGYDCWGEKAYQSKRKTGRINGLKGGRPKRVQAGAKTALIIDINSAKKPEV